jgi:hypothetical protein
VFIGYSADGERGQVLTSAHLFEPAPGGPPETLEAVTLNFGPRMAPQALRIPLTRVVIHPGYKHFQDRSSVDQAGFSLPVPMLAHDLAILEFKAAPFQAGLGRRGVRPAALDQGTGFRTPLLQAAIAGFGRFGTSANPKLAAQQTLYGGNTRVSYGAWRGTQAFMHWSQLSEAGLAARRAADPDGNRWQCELADTRKVCFNPGDRGPVPVLSDKAQAFGCDGDQGGPLFFNTAKGPVLAGIQSIDLVEALALPGGGHAAFLQQRWEPVLDHLEWIKEVQAGTLGRSGILQPGAPLGIRVQTPD